MTVMSSKDASSQELSKSVLKSKFEGEELYLPAVGRIWQGILPICHALK